MSIIYLHLLISSYILITSSVPENKIVEFTTIHGVINLPDSLQVSIGNYQNTLVENDPNFFFIWKKVNHESDFNVNFIINQPEIIEFYIDDKRRFRFYIEHGSTNNIIINENDYIIEGQTSKENSILSQLGFNKAQLKQPKYSNKIDLEKSLYELNAYCDSLESIIDLNDVSDDFKKYFSAEMFGYRYFWKSNLLYKYKNDTLGIDTLPKYVIENIHSLFQFNRIDETRSRYYLNSVSSYYHSLINLDLSKKEEDNLPLYLIASFNRINSVFNAFTNLKNILQTSIVNSAVYRAKNNTEIEFAEYLYKYYFGNTLNQENAFTTIKTELERKKIRFNLSKLENYSLMDSNNAIDSISNNAISKINILNFWASWCVPCIEKMPELISISSSKNINLLNINMWSTKSSWLKSLDQNNITNATQLFADKETSNKLADSCSITQFPLYIIIDDHLNIMFIFENFQRLKEYISNL